MQETSAVYAKLTMLWRNKGMSFAIKIYVNQAITGLHSTAFSSFAKIVETHLFVTRLCANVVFVDYVKPVGGGALWSSALEVPQTALAERRKIPSGVNEFG